MVSFELASGTYVDIDLVAAFSFEPQNFKKFPGKYVDPSLKIIPVKLPSAKWLFLYV